jgi:hypothetical protein
MIKNKKTKQPEEGTGTTTDKISDGEYEFSVKDAKAQVDGKIVNVSCTGTATLKKIKKNRGKKKYNKPSMTNAEFQRTVLEFIIEQRKTNENQAKFNEQQIEFNSQQREFNAKQEEFNNQQREFNAKQIEFNNQQREFNTKQIEFNNKQEKFNERIEDKLETVIRVNNLKTK